MAKDAMALGAGRLVAFVDAKVRELAAEGLTDDEIVARIVGMFREYGRSAR